MRSSEEAVGHWPVPGAAAAPMPGSEDAPSERGGRTLREYVSMLRRRWVQIVVVSALLMLAVAVIALSIPPRYRSSATILVQEQEVPPELVRSTITSFADERIQVISQQVMTRKVLLQLIEKYDLYPAQRDVLSSDALVERMRKDIRLTTIDANISDRSSGRRVNATIAFKISYDAHHPEPARDVANELVSLYLNENVKARQQSVAETAAFLAQESRRVAERIREIEANLAAFKRRNVGRTPDSSAVNLQLAERTDAELMRVEREITLLQDRAQMMQAQLASIDPLLPPPPILVQPLPPAAGPAAERALLPAERLRALQAQLASVSSIYSPEHPDVRRLQREIAALKAQPGAPAGADVPGRREELEAELARLKERYADDHPDVQRLKRAVAAARPFADAAKSVPALAAPAAAEPAARAENPAHVTLATQLEATRRELAQLAAFRDDLRSKQRDYDARLLQIPEAEREFRELTRDYESAQARYREIRAKESQAQVAQELEKDRKAERFSLGEPANLPQSPISPNRMQIAWLGILGSLGAGVGLAWLRDLLDPSVKGPLELARIASVPVLTPIPYIETHREQVRRRWGALTSITLALALVLGAAYAVDRYLKPLPAIVDALLRRLPFP